MHICGVNFDSVWKDKEANIAKKEQYIQQILGIYPKTSTIIFPELSLTGYVLDSDAYKLAEDMQGKSIVKIQSIAKQYNVNIIFGYIEKNDEKHPYNSLMVIGKNGNIISTYSKNHLFTQSVEPDMYSAGKELSLFELDGWKCGLSICFDIRYPRLYEAYKKAGAECIFTSYAWVSGRNKPEIFSSLSKARSAENQCFMVGVDAVGKDENNEYLGNAIISNPYAEDIKITHENIFHFASLDKNEITTISQMLPLQGAFCEKYTLSK